MTEEFITALLLLQKYTTGKHIFNYFENCLKQNEILITNITNITIIKGSMKKIILLKEVDVGK